MAIAANGVVANRGRISVWNLVRIVAGCAPQLPFALQEALGLAHAVYAIGNLKSVAHPPGAVERQPEIPQWLARYVGKRSAIQAADGMRQRSRGGLEMALHAHLQFPLGTQTPGIHDGRADLRTRRARPVSYTHLDVYKRQSQGAIAAANYRFELSIKLKPDYAGSHLGYARLLANTNRNDEAEKQAQAAVGADGGMAEAHELWGYLLAAKGDVDGAARELQSAVRLQPEFWRAQYELGAVLDRKGDPAAWQHLKLAAQGADPDAKASALELLKRLGH